MHVTTDRRKKQQAAATDSGECAGSRQLVEGVAQPARIEDVRGVKGLSGRRMEERTVRAPAAFRESCSNSSLGSDRLPTVFVET